jgi:hypothetical protein
MPIDATARWAREHNHQRIEVSGSYRLSTAFALGWYFRSAVGFEIDINTRAGLWATDDYSLPNDQPCPLEVTQPAYLVNNHLVVTVGILRDPKNDVQKSLSLSGDVILRIAYQLAITTGAEAQACIQGIKLAVSRTVSQYHPSSIDLFIAGPAALFVGLGHRWNGLPLTQVYEFLTKEGRYIPTFIIG